MGWQDEPLFSCPICQDRIYVDGAAIVLANGTRYTTARPCTYCTAGKRIGGTEWWQEWAEDQRKCVGRMQRTIRDREQNQRPCLPVEYDPDAWLPPG